MPPLQQPKTLFYLCCSEFSIFIAKCIRIASHPLSQDIRRSVLGRIYHIEEIKAVFRHIPVVYLETLFQWIIQSASLLIKVEAFADDRTVIEDYCDFILEALDIALDSRMRVLEQDFLIDFRQFGNFPLKLDSQEIVQVTDGPLVKDEQVCLSDISGSIRISTKLAEFLQTANHLETFSPGLFVVDRTSSDIISPQSSPQVVINLVQSCPRLTRLNLAGYNDLSDIVLFFISGEHEESPGLKLLEQIILPDHSYLTEDGVRSLLQFLPDLKYLQFDGNMARVFRLYWMPESGTVLKLENFSQLQSMSSGGVEEGDDQIDDIKCWDPSVREIERIAELCPNLTSLRVLVDDLDCRQLEGLPLLTQLEAHITWSGVTAGLEMYMQNAGCNLTTVELVLLDNFSWTSVAAIGEHCPLLTKFHLTLWREEMTDLDSLQVDPTADNKPFQFVQDLKIACESYLEFLPEQVLEFFLHNCQLLKILNITGPLDWIDPTVIHQIFSYCNLIDLEMLILSNTTSVPMMIGLEEIQLFVDNCPEITVIGDLRTWKGIDYYDENSPNYYSETSEFFQFKKETQKKNWDLDLDCQNIDFLYEKNKFIED